ncbi:MAG: hypothetical protein K6F07_00580 [Bacilli bacterium]|nr:hypothetical protein [Bacilli bacterium]
MPRKKKERRPRSYVAMHNAAVTRFQKASRIFIWAGVLNFVGLIIANIRFVSGDTEQMPFYFCFGISNYLFNVLHYYTSISQVWFYIIVYALSVLLSAGAVYLGVKSSQPSKKALLTCAALYLVDWIFVFLAFFLAKETWIGLLFNGGIHAIISFFLIFAIYEYYNVFNIEKQFIKPKPEVKEEDNKVKEENLGENKDGNI